MKTLQSTETIFDKILESSLFRLNGPDINLTESLQDLCEAINAEEETNWYLGECLDASLDSIIIGAYWTLYEWHAGQYSKSYRLLCSLGSIYDPGMSCGPEEDSSEMFCYEVFSEYYKKGGE